MESLKEILKNWKQKYKNGEPIQVSEIDKIEREYNITFPRVYRDFLEATGNDFLPLDNIVFEFDEIKKTAQKNARENLKEYGLEHLMPEHYWVIAEWDGSEVIWYIDLDQGDDPPVYGLNIVEYAEEPDEWWYEKEFNKFSDWVNEAIKEYEEHGHS